MTSVLESRVVAAASSVQAKLSPAPGQSRRLPHLAVLDGWRGVSILLVLVAHLVPLGPKAWNLNMSAGALGMVLFFNLSGFLITATLLERPQVLPFLVRRLCRILPLLWLVLLVLLPLVRAPLHVYLPSFLCYSNLPPVHLVTATGHLWSIGVEMQFYVFIALVIAVAGRRGMYVLPVAATAITAGRVWAHDPFSVVTTRRADEILAGAMLVMLHEGLFGNRIPTWFQKIPALVWLVLTALSCMPRSGPLQYLRPYLAMCLLGAVLSQPQARIVRAMQARWLIYLASISYAVYVLHGAVFHLPWFEPGNKMVLYARRPVGLLLVWALAHLSSRHYEAWWQRRGKLWADYLQRRTSKRERAGATLAIGSAR